MTLERRINEDRRRRWNAACERHYHECERRKAERRTALNHAVAEWQRKYDGTRTCQ